MGFQKPIAGPFHDEWIFPGPPRRAKLTPRRSIGVVLGALLISWAQSAGQAATASVDAVASSRLLLVIGFALVLASARGSISDAVDELTDRSLCEREPVRHWLPDAIWVPVGLVPLSTGLLTFGYLASDCLTIRFRDLDFAGRHIVLAHLGDHVAPFYFLPASAALILLGSATVGAFIRRRRQCVDSRCHTVSWFSFKALVLVLGLISVPAVYALFQGGNRLYR